MGQSLFKAWAKRKEARILMNGLDAAGKTTILYKLKLGEVVTTIPTIGFNVETINHRGINITAWDVGGRGKIRPLYRHYYANTDAILFIVDSNDRERMPEARDEMERMLVEDELRDAVIILLANKQDLPNAMSVAAVAKEMGFIDAVRSHRAAIFGCCATAGDGLYEALDFLSRELSSSPSKDPPSDKHPEKSSSEKTDTWSFTAYVKSTLKSLLTRVP